MEQRYNCPTDKLDAVLQAGLDEFSRRSFADANTETITQAAGISKGLLFHYFGSKKAFYLFCLQTALERLMAETPAPESDDFFEILFFVMDEKIRLCRDFPKETLFVNLAARDAVGVDQHQFDAAHGGILFEEVAGFLGIGELHGGPRSARGAGCSFHRSGLAGMPGVPLSL